MRLAQAALVDDQVLGSFPDAFHYVKPEKCIPRIACAEDLTFYDLKVGGIW